MKRIVREIDAWWSRHLDAIIVANMLLATVAITCSVISLVTK